MQIFSFDGYSDQLIRSSDSQHVMPCYAQVNKTRTIPHDATGMVINDALLTSTNVPGNGKIEYNIVC